MIARWGRDTSIVGNWFFDARPGVRAYSDTILLISSSSQQMARCRRCVRRGNRATDRRELRAPMLPRMCQRNVQRVCGCRDAHRPAEKPSEVAVGERSQDGGGVHTRGDVLRLGTADLYPRITIQPSGAAVGVVEHHHRVAGAGALDLHAPADAVG